MLPPGTVAAIERAAAATAAAAPTVGEQMRSEYDLLMSERANYRRAETNLAGPYVPFTRTCPCGSGLDVEWRQAPGLKAPEAFISCPPCEQCC